MAALSGCGDESTLPAGVVAKVGGRSIAQSTLERAVVGQRVWSRAAVKGVPYRPDGVKACIEAAERRVRATARESRERCQHLRRNAELAALRLLIRERWYALEAKAKGLRLEPLPPSALASVAQHSGVEVRDIVDVARAKQLRAALVPEATTPAQAPRFSKEEIAAYYSAHRRHYDVVSRRYIDALVAPTLELARRIARAFEREPSSVKLLKRFGDEGATRPHDRPVLDVASSGKAALARMVWRLEEGDVAMRRVPAGWYVFRLITISPRRPHPLQLASSQVEQELQARWVRGRYAAYNRGLRSKYRQDTLCSDRYELPECK